jgi:hypothetical protein
MPENLNDTASTLNQNAEYVRDRTHPQGKPYSRKQQESIAAAKGRTLLYNEDNPIRGVVFEGYEVNDALEDGWVDSPLMHPNNPNPVKAETKPEVDNEMAGLWAEVDRLNMDPRPHHRSGKNKLMDAIARYKDG